MRSSLTLFCPNELESSETIYTMIAESDSDWSHDVDCAINLGFDFFLSQLESNPTPLYQSLINANPTGAFHLYRETLAHQVDALKRIELQHIRGSLSAVLATIQRLKAIATLTDVQSKIGKTFVELYREYNIDEGNGRKMRNRGKKLQRFEADRVESLDSCSCLGTDGNKTWESFGSISHIYFVLDEIKDPNHVQWLLNNGVINYQGKFQRYGNYSVNEARAIVIKLKRRDILWEDLVGAKKPETSLDKSNDDARPSEETDHPKRVQSIHIDELISHAKEVRDISKLHFKKISKLRTRLKKARKRGFQFLKQEEKIVLRRAIDDAREGFENLINLFYDLEEICGKMELIGW